MAILYHPDGCTINGPKLMGCNDAGESLLRIRFAYSSNSSFWMQVKRSEQARHFTAVEIFGRTEPVRVVEKNNLAFWLKRLWSVIPFFKALEIV
jgi:hypothetical protein